MCKCENRCKEHGYQQCKSSKFTKSFKTHYFHIFLVFVDKKCSVFAIRFTVHHKQQLNMGLWDTCTHIGYSFNISCALSLVVVIVKLLSKTF